MQVSTRIDKHFPELWLGIDAHIFPYFRAIKEAVEAATDNTLIIDVVQGNAVLDAATDPMFVALRLHRIWFKSTMKAGNIAQTPILEDIPVTAITTRKERLVLVVGEAGAGKSTSLKRIAYVLAEKGLATEAKRKIPVLVRATQVWAQRSRSLVDTCVEAAMRVTNSSNPCFSSKDLKKGDIVVLLDALDELADDAAREGVISLALEFHSTYPECQIVATTRPCTFLETCTRLNLFTRFDLTPINYKQAQQIIKRFDRTRGLPSESSSELLRRLQEVHGMELNPLLVTVFAATTDYARKDIPANITELFKKFTEWMLGRWDSTKGLGQQYHAPLKDFLLRSTAFEMHRRRVTALPMAEFQAMVRTELEHRGRESDCAQLLDEILNRSGLLRNADGNVEFRHHLLQEFFAGRGIPSKEDLPAIIHDHWWQRPIVFYFGENPDQGSAFPEIIKSLSARTKPQVFHAALTLGLALQACYLVRTREKVDILRWVIETLSDAKEDFIREGDPEGKHYLSRFTVYYIAGRDAVACETLAVEPQAVLAPLEREGLTKDEKDTRMFWFIVGLLESGHLAEAQKALSGFQPKDLRFMLAIHIGCFLIANLKVTSKEEKKTAQEILSSIGYQISPLRQELIAEWKSELIELRRDKPAAIPMPTQKA